MMKIVGVTSCPSGVAHTYMAAEALQNAGEEKGYEVHIETQGAGGADCGSYRPLGSFCDRQAGADAAVCVAH